MTTQVSLLHERWRASPWVVRWYESGDSQTGGARRLGKLFQYQRDARIFQTAKQSEIDRVMLSGQTSMQGSAVAQSRVVPRSDAVSPMPIVLEECAPLRDEAQRAVTLQLLIDEVIASRVQARSYATRESYRNTIDQMLDHFGRERDIRSIEQRHAEAFLAGRKRLRGNGGELASWTIYHHRKHCRVIFGAAVEWGYLQVNPFIASRYSSATALKVRGRSRAWHHLTPEEFRRMLEHVRRPQRRAAYWLMYGCGLRPGEVYNLTVDRIDLHRKRVLIANRTSTPDIPPFTVKADGQSLGGKERSVPIPDAALAEIRTAMGLAKESGGFIALTPDRFAKIHHYWHQCREVLPWGNEPRHRPWQNRDMLNNLLRDTRGYLRKGGVELSASLTLHTFRKSFAQNHADAGTPPRTLAKLLGHSDVSVTLQFYNRVTDANELAAAEAMNRLLNGQSPKKTRR